MGSPLSAMLNLFSLGPIQCFHCFYFPMFFSSTSSYSTILSRPLQVNSSPRRDHRSAFLAACASDKFASVSAVSLRVSNNHTIFAPSHTCLHARRPSSRQDAHPSDLVACYTVGYNIHDTPSFRGGDFVPFLNFWPPNSGHAWAYLHHLTATPLAAATYPRLHSLFESIDLS